MKTVNVDAQFIRMDNLGNILVINNQEIIKYNQNGEFYLRSSNKLLGDISHIDATNALKIYFFSLDLSQLQILDNKLGERGTPLALDELGFEQVNAIAYSYNNGIWLFDALEFELYRLDQNLVQTLQSGNLISLLGFTPNTSYLVERNKWLYLVDRENGILVFDIFGTYFKTIPIKDIEKISVFNGDIVYKKGKTLRKYSPITLSDELFFESKNEIVDFEVQKDRMCVLSKGQLFVYKI